MATELPYAEDINYFKTSKSTPDAWLEKAADLIEKIGGKVSTYAFGNDIDTGRQAYLFDFTISGERFRCVWPVLPQEYKNNELAAKRQAATLLFHDIKNKCLNSKIKGHRRAFFEYVLLPNGMTPPDLSDGELVDNAPELFGHTNQKLITT